MVTQPATPNVLPDTAPGLKDLVKRAATNVILIPGVLATVIAIVMWLVVNNGIPKYGWLNVPALFIIAITSLSAAGLLLIAPESRLLEKNDEENDLPAVISLGFTKMSKTLGFVFTAFVGFLALVFALLWLLSVPALQTGSDWVYFTTLVSLLILVIVFMTRSNGPQTQPEWEAIKRSRQQARQANQQQTAPPVNVQTGMVQQLVTLTVPSAPQSGNVYSLHIADAAWVGQVITILFEVSGTGVVAVLNFQVPATARVNQQIPITIP